MISTQVYTVRFSPNSETLLTANYDGTARTWNVATGDLDQTLVNKANHSSIRAFVIDAEFSPDGTVVATGSSDGVVRIWDVASGIRDADFRGLRDLITQVAFSSDGRKLAASSFDGTAEIWDVDTGAETARLAGHTGYVEAIAFDSLGQRVVTGGQDGTVRVWESDTGAVARVLGTEVDQPMTVKFAANGGVLETDLRGATRLWDASGQQVGRAMIFDPGSVIAWWRGAISPNDTMVAASDLVSNDVLVWNPQTGTLVADLKGHTGSIQDVAWSPDGRYLAAVGSDDGMLWIWDTSTWQSFHVIDSGVALQSVAFSPDSKLIAAGDNGGVIWLWKVASGALTKKLDSRSNQYLYSVAFSPDGTHLVAGSGDNLGRVWDIESGTSPLVLRGHTNYVTSAAFSADGKLVATGDWNGEMRIWDATSGQLLAILHGHATEIREIVFSNDDDSILSIANSGPALVTPCDVCGSVDRLLQIAEDRGTRELTADEQNRYLDAGTPAAATPVTQ